MATLNFDASQVAPQEAFEVIPAGWYNAMIDESDIKPTKDGGGRYLELRFSVLDGQYAGRKLFQRLNIVNANPTAQEIAYKQLSAIAHAVGILQVPDSTVLHNRPLKIKVKVRAAAGEYEASNEINGWENVNKQVGGAAPAQQAAPAFVAPPAQQAPQFAPPAQAQQGFAQPPQGFAPPAQFVQPQQAVNPAQFAQQPVQQAQPAQPWAQQPQGQAPAPQPWEQAPTQQAPVQQMQPAVQPAAQPWNNPASAGAQAATPPWMNPQTHQQG